MIFTSSSAASGIAARTARRSVSPRSASLPLSARKKLRRPMRASDTHRLGIVKHGSQEGAGDDIVHIPREDAKKIAEYQGDVIGLRRHARTVLAMLTELRSAGIAALRWQDL